MKRALPHPLALAILALALLPASASAKEVVKAQVCGAGDCVDVSRTLAMDLMDGGPPTDPPKEAAPFFTARLWVKVDDGKTQRFDTAFVPRYGLMRGDDGTWMDAPVQTEAALMRKLPDCRLKSQLPSTFSAWYRTHQSHQFWQH